MTLRLARRHAILAVGGVLTLLVLWAVAVHVRAVETGRELLLEAQGYDPRALLSGHYAAVVLPIGRAPAGGDGAPKGLEDANWVPSDRWAPVFVVLSESTGAWRVAALGLEPPKRAEGDLLVRAQARRRGNISLRYGIERVYAQQKEAEALQDLLRSPEARVEIVASLGGDRRLRLKGIVIDGERRDFSWW